MDSFRPDWKSCFVSFARSRVPDNAVCPVLYIATVDELVSAQCLIARELSGCTPRDTPSMSLTAGERPA